MRSLKTLAAIIAALLIWERWPRPSSRRLPAGNAPAGQVGTTSTTTDAPTDTVDTQEEKSRTKSRPQPRPKREAGRSKTAEDQAGRKGPGKLGEVKPRPGSRPMKNPLVTPTDEPKARRTIRLAQSAIKPGDWNQWGGTSLCAITRPLARDRHRVGAGRFRPQDGRVEPSRREETSNGLASSAARPTATRSWPLARSGSAPTTATAISSGIRRRRPGRAGLLQRGRWKVSLAAFQREASHRPRSRLAAARHLLLAAGRGRPDVVRHQPRRSAAASTSKAFTTARTMAGPRSKSRPGCSTSAGRRSGPRQGRPAT